ncbi:hypothetical protein OCOL_001397 [Ordospora colligata]|uniref:FHA domain-containing protein n=1 Tax=Ordospora colligata OC4 TaxID=1354746 RepID=A0A0B2UK09_9MICR|nr:uncharacterized protein M896_060840 [Ordospora colligata OC4]KHN69584.1 hypothetical protein M896_060840 [Ordospora colligata OC4]TBU15404.1 hypothetical protein CWI41_060830 [Ordospora colligata]
MNEKYKLQSLGSEEEVKSVVFTNEPEVSIGSGIDADVRLQQPSIKERHVIVYFEHMKMRVLGENVFLNEEAIEKGSMCEFRFGDVVRICRYRFVFSQTEPGDFIDDSKVIRKPRMEMSYLSSEMTSGEVEREEPISVVEDKKMQVVDKSGEGMMGEAVVSIALNKVSGVYVSLGGDDHANVSCIKQVIEEQKEVLEKEIEESIEHGAVDTPVIASLAKKQGRDLGEVMIEKELLSNAEKIVEEKMRNEHDAVELELDELKQSVKDSIKEELREDLRRDFMNEVKEEIRDEVKEVLMSSEMKEAIATDVIGHIDVIQEQINVDEGSIDEHVGGERVKDEVQEKESVEEVISRDAEEGVKIGVVEKDEHENVENENKAEDFDKHVEDEHVEGIKDEHEHENVEKDNKVEGMKEEHEHVEEMTDVNSEKISRPRRRASSIGVKVEGEDGSEAPPTRKSSIRSKRQSTGDEEGVKRKKGEKQEGKQEAKGNESKPKGRKK